MTLNSEEQQAFSDREWWSKAGGVLGLTLNGWTFRSEARFTSPEGASVYLPGPVAEKLLDLCAPIAALPTGDLVERLLAHHAKGVSEYGMDIPVLREAAAHIQALTAERDGRVRPLVWHDNTEGPGCPIRFAAWPLHGYRIHLYQWGEADTWAVSFGSAQGVFLPKKCDSDEAKAAVQEEWSSYLQRAALNPEGDGA